MFWSNRTANTWDEMRINGCGAVSEANTSKAIHLRVLESVANNCSGGGGWGLLC